MTSDYELETLMSDGLSSLDYWRLCDQLSVIQAVHSRTEYGSSAAKVSWSIALTDSFRD
jgi:hypothetical protein